MDPELAKVLIKYALQAPAVAAIAGFVFCCFKYGPNFLSVVLEHKRKNTKMLSREKRENQKMENELKRQIERRERRK